jgi:hypothetical protein
MDDDEIYEFAYKKMNEELDFWDGADLRVADQKIALLGDIEDLSNYTDEEIKNYITDGIETFKEIKEEEEKRKQWEAEAEEA